MKTVSIHVDRFTTVRRRVSNKAVERAGTRAMYAPEYFTDQKRGERQVDEGTHQVKVPGETYEEEEKPDDVQIRTDAQRPAKMFKCRLCGVKSESKKLMKKHVRVCREVNA